MDYAQPLLYSHPFAKVIRGPLDNHQIVSSPFPHGKSPLIGELYPYIYYILIFQA